MQFGRGVQYTLQALLYMAAQPPGTWVATRDIADRLDLPLHFLAKLMRALGESGWLISQRGKNGGYRLADAALELSFLDILKVVQAPDLDSACLLGLKDCGDQDACVLHCQWQPIKGELLDYYRDNSLRQLVSGQEIRSPASSL